MGRYLFGSDSFTGGLFGSMWSFLWSSIRVRELLADIYSFRELICHEWWWISWIKIFAHFIFFRVIFCKSMCISAFGPSSSPSNSFAILLINSAFFLCSLGGHILLQNCSVSLASGCWYVFMSSPTTCWYNFLSLFCHGLLCLYCFTLCLYFLNLPPFSSIFWFISSSCIIIFSYVAFSFLSSCVSCRISPLNLNFCLCSIREPRFSPKLCSCID